MTRTQLKCMLAVHASDMKLKLQPGFLDSFVDRIEGRAFDARQDIADEFLEAVRGPERAKRREQRRRAREVEAALVGRPKRERREYEPRMTQKLIRECIAAGRDWAADAAADAAAGYEMETDGSCEARDLAQGISPHPTLTEACADYVYDGICKQWEKSGFDPHRVAEERRMDRRQKRKLEQMLRDAEKQLRQ